MLWAQVVEKLYRLKWGRLDGLGALIISPTRELAMQIFDELRKVGAKHDLSAGLLIGGKSVKEEQGRVNGTDSNSCPKVQGVEISCLLSTKPDRTAQQVDSRGKGWSCVRTHRKGHPLGTVPEGQVALHFT